ncbi:MAG: NnrU family protein, partial [Gammaproteobacteria bacterium]|nr:NnrU family protein [Gammaproteobacteria bacterium]MDA8024480.1 NnrU family protein [Gammaproteobacteria bacterium]
AAPAMRAQLAARMGERGYMIAFSALSFAGLFLMVRGLRTAERVLLWQPPEIAGAIAVVVMLPAMVLIASTYFDNHITRTMRHPMNWGFLLGSACHFFANGELDAMLLFGGFAVYAFFYLRMRAPKREFRGKPSWRLDAVAVVIGIAAYALLGYFHYALFGEFPIPY